MRRFSTSNLLAANGKFPDRASRPFPFSDPVGLLREEGTKRPGSNATSLQWRVSQFAWETGTIPFLLLIAGTCQHLFSLIGVFNS